METAWSRDVPAYRPNFAGFRLATIMHGCRAVRHRSDFVLLRWATIIFACAMCATNRILYASGRRLLYMVVVGDDFTWGSHDVRHKSGFARFRWATFTKWSRNVRQK